MKNVLDRPAWSALATRHEPFGEGGSLARRYRPSIVPFAASVDDGPESLRALAVLAGPGERMLFLQADPVALPDELQAVMTSDGVQMVAAKHIEPPADARPERLAEADAAAMLELAALTKPGPFTLEAMKLGEFWGVRIDGRLAAMAGERMKQPGFTEISGVCCHPDFRGQGLARLLSLHVAARIFARGETPYLHAFSSNAAAIALYGKIGFALRTDMHVAMAERRA